MIDFYKAFITSKILVDLGWHDQITMTGVHLACAAGHTYVYIGYTS
jgi:hypothetical protein